MIGCFRRAGNRERRQGIPHLHILLDFQIIILYTARQKAYSLFATVTIPRIYLSDKEGIIRAMWVEEIGLDREQLLEEIKSYLAEMP